jgi:hypothetical protein
MLTAAAAKARPWAKSAYSVSGAYIGAGPESAYSVPGAYIGAGPDQKVLTAFRVLTPPDRSVLAATALFNYYAVQR